MTGEHILDIIRPTHTSAEAASRVRYEVLGTSFLMAFLMYMERGAIGAAAPSIMREFHVDKITMGWALSAFSWLYAMCQVPGGWMADRFGPRVVLAVAMAWWSIFTAATALSFNAISLAATRLLFGAGEAAAFPAGSRAVGYLATHFGWTLPFLLASTLCLLSAWLVSRIDPRRPVVEES